MDNRETQNTQNLSENAEKISGKNDSAAENETLQTKIEIGEQTQFLDAVFSAISDFAYIFDRDGRFIFANRALLDFWNLKLEELTGKNFEDLNYEPNLAAKLRRQINEVIETKQKVRDEDYYTDPSGAEGFYEYIFSPIFAADGSVEAIAGTTRDISLRRQTQKNLIDSEELLQGTINALTGHIAVLDESGVIIKVNETWRNFAQENFYTGNDFGLGQNYIEAFMPHEAVENSQGCDAQGMEAAEGIRCVADKKLDSFELEYPCHSPNEQRWFLMRVTRFDTSQGDLRLLIAHENITSRKIAEIARQESEEAIRESQLKLQTALSAGRMGSWELDLTTGELRSSDTCKANFGRKPTDDFTYEDLQNSIYPEDLEYWREQVQTAIENCAEFQFEYRTVWLNKSVQWILVSGNCFADETGKVINLAGVTSNITQRKNAEEKIHEAEQRYRNLFNSIDEGFCTIQVLFDDAGKPIDYIFLEINDAFEKQTNLLDPIGKRMREFIPNHEEAWFEIYGRIAMTGIPERFEQQAAALDSWFDLYAFRVGEPHERKVAVIFKNIAERKKLEIRNRFILSLDETVRPLETPEEITKTLARLLGEHLGADRCAYAEVEADENHFYIPGDYTKDDTPSIVGRYQMRDFGAEVLRLMRENKTYVVNDVDTDAQVTKEDLAAYRKTNIQSVICVPLHKNNRFAACMAVHQKRPRRWLSDEIELVTFVANRFWESIERARSVKSLHESLNREQELRQQSEQANRLKDEFLATLSHELRTPLNAILGWTQILLNRRLEETDRTRAITTIDRSARSQNQLIEDILDISRIITGKMRLDVQAIDLVKIISAAVETARPAADAKNIRIHTMLDLRIDAVSGDPDRLQQVVWNLLSNAVKFTPKEGQIKVKLERVNSHIEITISDTGKGIEAEFLPFVFDRFRQSDGSMTRRQGGLGLGLAIVRQIVELHGGTVSVTSAGENQGASFTVHLPLFPVRQKSENESPRIHPTAEGNGKTFDKNDADELAGFYILIVDDEADSRDLLETVLISSGAKVKPAKSAAEAFQIAAAEKFDIIISDIGMPEEDGFSLIRKIRNLPPEKGGNTPAIALTAYARSEDRIKALRSGFQMHIAKPVEHSELIATITVLGKTRS